MADKWDEKARELLGLYDKGVHAWPEVAAIMHAIDTAAYQRGIERAAKACNLVGDDWRDAGIELKAFAADYLAAYIRALAQPAGEKGDWAPETRHERDCAYVTSAGPAPCTCKAGLAP